jgi:hypothetical protein
MPTLKEDKYTRIPTCQPGYALVLTPDGIKKISDISSGSKIWSGTEFVKVKAKRSAGSQNVYQVKTTAGTVYCTLSHKVMSNGLSTTVSSAESLDLCVGPDTSASTSFHAPTVMDGLVLLHGNVDDKGTHLLVQHKDDKFLTEKGMAGLFDGDAFMHNPDHYYVKSSLSDDELVEVVDREIPETLIFSSEEKIRSLLRGLFSANGSVTGLHHGSPRVSLKLTSPKILECSQILLSSLGISSYFTYNPSKKVSFKNGFYTTTPSWDLNVGSSPARKLYQDSIGFIQEHKLKRLREANVSLTQKGPKVSYDIVEKNQMGKEPCFDLILDGATTYWSGGILVCDGSV